MNDHKPVVFHGRIVKARTERVELPNGQRIDLDVVDHPGGAAVVAIDDDNRVCLLEQHRHVMDRSLIELPAGKLEPDEDPLTTAKRELAEEAGLIAGKWKSLGMIASSPGVFTEIVHLYLATELSSTTPRVEPGEIFELEWRPLAAAAYDALSGVIEDAKTAIGLVRAAHRLGVTPAA